MVNWIKQFLDDEDATTTVEYAVMLMLIIGTCLTIVQALGSGSNGLWANNSAKIGAAMGS